jgi:hypothetical protein
MEPSAQFSAISRDPAESAFEIVDKEGGGSVSVSVAR